MIEPQWTLSVQITLIAEVCDGKFKELIIFYVICIRNFLFPISDLMKQARWEEIKSLSTRCFDDFKQREQKEYERM